MLQQKNPDRPKTEHHEGMSIQAVAQATRFWQIEVFLDRKSFHIADAAMVEIASSCVMLGVSTPPMIIWRERQYPKQPSRPVI